MPIVSVNFQSLYFKQNLMTSPYVLKAFVNLNILT